MDSSKIDAIYEKLARSWHETFGELKSALLRREGDKSMLKLFPQIKNRPQIVTDEIFRQNESPLWFSGVRNYRKSVKWFQKGAFKWRNGAYGNGFYFSTDLATADTYARDGIMVAKPTDDAQIVSWGDLLDLVLDETPRYTTDLRDSIPKKSKLDYERAAVVGTYLRLPNTETISAFLFNKDIISAETDSYGTFYCVANRAAVMTPQNPSHKRFIEPVLMR